MAGILDSVQGMASGLVGKSKGIIDSIIPPEKRAELLTKLQTFAITNPKLAGFLLANLALTGLPLAMFILFTITVFVFSLIVSLLVGLLAALLFTVFMVGMALLVILPTVFFITMAATFIFLWGLGGYYIVKWFNEDPKNAPKGTAIGDKLNSLTGGRMSFLMDGARDARDKKDQDEKDSDGLSGLNGHANTVKKNVPGGKEVGNVTDKVTKTANTDDVQKKVGGVTNKVGSAKGLVGGATGLT